MLEHVYMDFWGPYTRVRNRRDITAAFESYSYSHHSWVFEENIGTKILDACLAEVKKGREKTRRKSSVTEQKRSGK